MARLISVLFIPVFLLAYPAYAGFEWVPPMKNPGPLPQKVEESSVPASLSSEMGMAVPAPAVSAEPLNDGLKPMPIPLSREQPVSVPTKTKNLSGKKLVIDPYPLQGQVAEPETPVNISEVYKAMNEEAGKLHPVRLGNGMTTGAKKKSAPVPRAPSMSSSSHKTFLTPTTDTGITPMIGAEPPPLPGMAASQASSNINSSKTYAEAVGFGRDLPLALALSQVIPSEFTHSFAKNVDAGAMVSWEGGKPWNQVLNNMLQPKNLMAVIQDNQVIIQPIARL